MTNGLICAVYLRTNGENDRLLNTITLRPEQCTIGAEFPVFRTDNGKSHDVVVVGRTNPPQGGARHPLQLPLKLTVELRRTL